MATAAAIVAAAVIGSYASSQSAKSAANKQSASADAAARLQKESADAALALQRRVYEEGVARQTPWLDAGQKALVEYKDRLRAGFTYNSMTADPGYKFRLEQSQRALEQSASGGGNLFGAGTQLALQRQAQGLASEEYGNAYNRWINQNNAVLGLSNAGQAAAGSMSGQGQSFANASGQTLLNTASNIGALGLESANAQAAARIVQTNAYNNALQQGVSAYTLYGNSNTGAAQSSSAAATTSGMSVPTGTQTGGFDILAYK